MTTGQPAESAAIHSSLDCRLDGIDRLLLGVLPRADRLALMAIVESRLRAAVDPAAERASVVSPAWLQVEAVAGADLPVSGVARPVCAGRRSRLALWSGLLGILACLMLFGLPVVYVIIASFGESLGDTVAIGSLVGYTALFFGGALVAVGLGIPALWRLNSAPANTGRGWAITGLCTATLPLGLGALALLFLGLELGGSVSVQSESSDSSGVSLPVPVPPYGQPSPGAPTPWQVVPAEAMTGNVPGSGQTVPAYVFPPQPLPPLARPPAEPAQMPAKAAPGGEIDARPAAPALPVTTVSVGY